MKNTTMVPFVKWVGGKRQIIKQIEKFWPKDKINTYYEPFVGGGFVLFYFHPDKAVINDLNKELMNCYNVIKNKTSLKRLKEYLILMEYGNHILLDFDEEKQKDKKTSPFYKKIASIDRNETNTNHMLSLKNASKELRAARVLFLNKNGFNGLYRVNGSGYYNTPSKHSPTKTFDENNLLKIHEYLNNSNIKIINKTFEDAVANAIKGDFVYFDPPYDYEKNVKGFDAYQKNGFGTHGQEGLAETFDANRLVGGRGASRGKVKEVLVMNYEV